MRKFLLAAGLIVASGASLAASDHIATYASSQPSVVAQQPEQSEQRQQQRREQRQRERGSLLFGTAEGMQGLIDLLNASQETDNPTIREIAILTTDIEGEDQKKMYFAQKVIDEFVNVVDMASVDLSPEDAAAIDLENNGFGVRIGGGRGALRLRIKDNMERPNRAPFANFTFNRLDVPGYESVNQIRFVAID